MIKAGAINFLQELIAAAFILLFAYTGFSKLIDHEVFLNALQHSPVTSPLSGALVYLVPIDELAVAGLLLIPAFRRVGFLLATLAMAIFTTYIAWLLLTAEELPCSCGGVISALSWKQHLVFNIFFLALGAQGYILSRPRQTAGVAEHP